MKDDLSRKQEIYFLLHSFEKPKSASGSGDEIKTQKMEKEKKVSPNSKIIKS